MSILLAIFDLVYYFLLIVFVAQMIFSIARVDPYHPTWGKLMQLTYRITEPILQPVRRQFPPQGGADFSPMIVIFGLLFLRIILRSFF